MKLEVGQKIGIYEIIEMNIENGESHSIGSQHLGEHHKDHVKLFDATCDIPDWFDFNEVRKVGSLIVKRLK